MDKRIGVAARVAAALLVAAALAACGARNDKFMAQLQPIVARITERVSGTAALTGKDPAATIAKTTEYLTDLAGLGADLKGLYVEGDKQQAMVAAGQAYLSATQRFVTSQQEFARAYMRLEAARAKVRESLDAKARFSKNSLDFWKETHDRVVLDLDKVRIENEKARAALSAATSSIQQAAEATGAVIGREALVTPAVLDAHRKALEAVPLQKGA
jgi:hypothetical protein